MNYNPASKRDDISRERLGFRPLAGVNYNEIGTDTYTSMMNCFRPLAGVNYNEKLEVVSVKEELRFPSPCGGEL